MRTLLHFGALVLTSSYRPYSRSALEIQTTRALLLSSGAITLVNGAFHLLRHGQHIGY